MINKYTALIIVFLILIIGYYVVVRKKEGLKKTKKTKKSKKTRKTKRNNRRKAQERRTQQDDEDTSEDEEDENEENVEDRKIADDAEELYNLVHDALCKGIQHEEFEEIAGDIAGNIAFIDLKQLYNQCLEKKMDPMRVITVQDYIRILKKEDGD
jgi:hypothetical protein